MDESQDYPLIPYTVIPVNTTGCGSSDTGVVCPNTPSPTQGTSSSTAHPHSSTSSSSSSSSSTHSVHPHSSTSSSSSSSTHSTSSSSVSHSSPSIVPTSPPVPESPFSSSCDAMEDVRKQLSKGFSDPQYPVTCVRKGCNVIDCSADYFELIITLHCSKPAGIEITAKVLGFTDSTLFNESGVFDDVDWYVTVNITYDLVLGFALTNVTDGATVVSYTLIPLDSCSGREEVCMF